jgi:hypothetical protein
MQARRSGMAIVLSDFLLPDGYQTGLKHSRLAVLK